jgi:hypothetical protein
VILKNTGYLDCKRIDSAMRALKGIAGGTSKTINNFGFCVRSLNHRDSTEVTVFFRMSDRQLRRTTDLA